MAEKDINTKEWQWLRDLMDRALWPLDGIIKTLEKYDDDLEDLLVAMAPLVDIAKANLEVLDDLLGKSFGGHVKVETTNALRLSGSFRPGDFGKAFVDSTKGAQAEPEGGQP